MPTTGEAQGLLKHSTEVTKCLECDATGVYILKLPYGGCGSERVNLKLLIN